MSGMEIVAMQGNNLAVRWSMKTKRTQRGQSKAAKITYAYKDFNMQEVDQSAQIKQFGYLKFYQD